MFASQKNAAGKYLGSTEADPRGTPALDLTRLKNSFIRPRTLVATLCESFRLANFADQHRVSRLAVGGRCADLTLRWAQRLPMNTDTLEPRSKRGRAWRVRDVAKLFNVSTRTVEREIERGRLKADTLSRRAKRIFDDAIDAYADKLTRGE
jgi:hypothetical protein